MIEKLIKSFDTDILCVERVWKHADQHLTFDWIDLIDSHHLNNYNLFIFNSELNHLDKYNKLNRSSEESFDGIKFNGMLNADYMLQLKKYQHVAVDVQDYGAYYILFGILAFPCPLFNQISAATRYPPLPRGRLHLQQDNDRTK